MTWRLDIEYDGTPFKGWARQEDERTVQGEIEAAIGIALGTDQVTLTVAGRTDAGVHATGQVASFEFPDPLPDDILRSLNGLTPPEIAITAVTRAPDGFDARRDAVARSYRYLVSTGGPESPFTRGRAWRVFRRLDRELLDRSAALVVGEHDFTAFTPPDTYHRRFTRKIESAEWVAPTPGDARPDLPSGPGAQLLEFRVTGDSFMRNMVRILVGTMVEVASGRRELEEFAGLLEGMPRVEAGVTAPAHGLYLTGVRYREPAGS